MLLSKLFVQSVLYRFSQCDKLHLARSPRTCIMLSSYLRFSPNIFRYYCGVGPIINKMEFGKMVRKVLLVVALIVVMFSLLGCQTVQGLGGDIKWTGEKGAEVLEQ